MTGARLERAREAVSWAPGEVWAPEARRAELVLEGGEVLAMRQAGGGRFRPASALPSGARYRISLDGADPRPDPRSHRQPEGVHGPSEVVDHGAFAWTDHDWRGFDLRTAVLYELHVGTFGDGTFQGVIDHLPELSSLGVDAIELLPVTTFDGDRGWGYDGVFLYSVHEPYGGPDGLRALVDEAHAQGLGVILDVVYNHLGPTGNVLPLFGPYLTDRHRTPWGDAVNFDGPGSQEVRRFVIDNVWHWVEHYHVDGFRLDATHAIIDDSPTPILDELAAEMAEASKRVGRRIWMVAEHEDVDERLVRDPEHGGAGMDAVWNDPVHHALHALLTGERDGYYAPWGSVADLARVLAQRAVRPGDGLAPERFVIFDQNHDQVGNRAGGERLGHLVGTDLAMVAAALTLLAPGVPMLFMGEEWGASSPFPYFCGERSPELDDAVRRGRREEFASFCWDDVPDPVAIETAESARLVWTERAQGDHGRLLDWYARVIELRRSLGPDAATLVTFDEADRWVNMVRGSLQVAINLAVHAQAVPCADAAHRAVLAASSEGVSLREGSVTLPAGTLAVLGPA